MTARLSQILLCAALLPGLFGGVGGDRVRELASDAKRGTGHLTAERESAGDVVVERAPMEALPFLHRGKCDELPAGVLSAGLRGTMMPLDSALPRGGVQVGATTGAPGFPVEIQHPRLLI